MNAEKLIMALCLSLGCAAYIAGAVILLFKNISVRDERRTAAVYYFLISTLLGASHLGFTFYPGMKSVFMFFLFNLCLSTSFFIYIMARAILCREVSRTFSVLYHSISVLFGLIAYVMMVYFKDGFWFNVFPVLILVVTQAYSGLVLLREKGWEGVSDRQRAGKILICYSFIIMAMLNLTYPVMSGSEYFFIGFIPIIILNLANITGILLILAF